MPTTTTKLTTAVEEYFSDLRRIRASGGATGERSYYPALTNLLNAVGSALKPQVFCVSEIAEQGAGHPDLGLYARRQVQKGTPRPGQVPERGVVEVKPSGDDAWLTAASTQVSRYWDRYRVVLVTNTRTSYCWARTPRAIPLSWRPSDWRIRRRSLRPIYKSHGPLPERSARALVNT